MQNAKINANYIFCIDVKMQNANLLFCINVTMQMQKLFAFCIDFKCKCKNILPAAAEIRLAEMILKKISQKIASVTYISNIHDSIFGNFCFFVRINCQMQMQQKWKCKNATMQMQMIFCICIMQMQMFFAFCIGFCIFAFASPISV